MKPLKSSAEISEEVSSLSFREKSLLRSAYFWIHQSVNKASSLEQMQGLLEAIDALEKLSAWDLVHEILIYRLPHEANLPFHEKLRKIGLVKEQIHLFQSLVGQIAPSVDILCLTGLGFAQTQLGLYPQAIEYFLQGLEIANQEQRNHAINRLLYGLAYSHMYWGKYAIAERYTHQLLRKLDSHQTSSCDIDGPIERGKALAALGYCQYFLRHFTDGISYNQQALQIGVQYQDVETQWMALGSLSLIYSQLGQYQEALVCQQQRLLLHHDSIDEYHLITAQIDLGANYCYQRDFSQAEQILKAALCQAKARQFIRAQCQALRLLGFIYSWQGNAAQAISYLEQGIAIAAESEYTHLHSQMCALLSYVHSGCGHIAKSLRYGQKALHLSENLGFQNNLYQASALMALGLAQLHQRHWWTGWRLLLKGFITLPPWKNTDSKILFALVYRRLRLG